MKHTERGGPHYRVCDPAWTDPLDVTFAKRNGGRWNAPDSFGVLYMNATIAVAAANARRAYENEIATLFDLRPEHRPDLQIIDVKTALFVDATTDAGLRALRLPQTYPVGATWEQCRKIGKRTYANGEKGIVCRSADATVRTGVTIEGDELVVFDTALSLVRRGMRVPFNQWYPLEVEHP